MDSNKLSAVIEKKIRHLCLNDFPCGYGSWRKTKDSAQRAGTEETDSLLDLLNCPHSPWRQDKWWSPQIPSLRELAVLTPERLHTNFIHSYFIRLSIVDMGVTAIDRDLLKFSKLEELVLSVNKISEIPVENLPVTLKVLEVRANRLSSLSTLTTRPPPRLQYLSLGSNSLGSHEDVAHLTGRHWPQLVCLDLSDCEFQDQPTLLNALNTLPCLRSLVLEGNPFTLASSYPGFTVDRLPQLSFLDASRISAEERYGFRGLAAMTGLIMDQASVTVSVGRVRGVPDPTMTTDKNSANFPLVTCSYCITYDFISHQTPVDLNVGSETKVEPPVTAHVMGDSCRDAELKCDRQTCEADAGASGANTVDNSHDTAHVSRHITPKSAWSECMDLSGTQTHIVSDLGGLKKFFNQGLHLSLEEEKVLSWPAAPEEKKGGKGKDSSVKSDSSKDKQKDKKKKSVPELVQDAPIRRILGSVHIPLQSLLKGRQKVNILCDLGAIYKESEVEATPTLEKDLGKKIKDEDKEDKESALGKGRGIRLKNSASSKGKGRKAHEEDILAKTSMCVPLEPLTVEFSVELEKWSSVSEAQKHLLQHN